MPGRRTMLIPLTRSAHLGRLTTMSAALATLLLGTARFTSAQSDERGTGLGAARVRLRIESQTPDRSDRHEAPLTVDAAVALARANNPAVAGASMRRRAS